jgi:hypothetical protein
MFAVIDRTNLTVALDANAAATGMAQPAQPLAPGPRPFFVNSLTAVTQPGQMQITVPCTAGGNANFYEEMQWGINAGDLLVVDTGPNQEVVTVAGAPTAGGNGIQITATFRYSHPAGFAVSNALLGHPGPQPGFDPRNPRYSGVVRYFSIIE